MIASNERTRKKIIINPYFRPSLAGIVAIFAVTFFAYYDFNIRMIYGYSLLCIYAFLCLCFTQFKVHLSKEKLMFFFLAMMISIFVFLNGNKQGVIVYAMGMDLCVFIALLYEPQQTQYIHAMKVFYIFSIIFSLYSILTFVFPEIYQTFIKPIISEESAKYNEELLRDGYGVALGANVVFIAYIIATGLIFSLNCYFAGQKMAKLKILNVINIILCFLGMLCVNRKGELLALLATSFLLYRDHMKKSSKKEKVKTRHMFIFAAILTAIVVAYMVQKGYLVRFYIFFNKIIRNFSKDKVDISSGRIIIWKYAIKIFKQNPVFGIGWENFSAKIPEYNIDTVKVHNNFIQLLCETGVIGFVLIALPMMMLLIRTYHYMRRYLYNEQSQSIIRIAYTTSFGIQFFFFVLDFIDPCIYKMNFWPIYTISIMSLIFARTYEKNTKFS